MEVRWACFSFGRCFRSPEELLRIEDPCFENLCLAEVAAVARASRQFVVPSYPCYGDQHLAEAVVAAHAILRVVAPSGDP